MIKSDVKYNTIDLVCEMLNQYENLDNSKPISIVAKYEEANDIVNLIIRLSDDTFDLCISELKDNLIGGYNEEFFITLFGNTLYVERAKSKNEKYLKCDDHIVYLLDNCNSAIIKCLHCDMLYFVELDEYSYDNENECLKCDCSTSSDEDEVNSFEHTKSILSDDGDIIGITRIISEGNMYSRTTVYNSDKEELESLMEKFGITIM